MTYHYIYLYSTRSQHHKIYENIREKEKKTAMNTTTDDNDNCDESDNDKMMKLRVLSYLT